MRLRFWLVVKHPVYSYRTWKRKLPITEENIQVYRKVKEATKKLESKDVRTKLKAACDLIYTLALNGADISSSFPSLLKLLKDKRIKIRSTYIYPVIAAGEDKKKQDKIVEEIITALEDKDPETRLDALYALKKIIDKNVDARKATRQLGQALIDPDIKVREFAIDALQRGVEYGLQITEILGDIKMILEGEEIALKWSMFDILLKSIENEENIEIVVPTLIDLLEDENTIMRDYILLILYSARDNIDLQEYTKKFVELLEKDMDQTKRLADILVDLELSEAQLKKVLEVTRKDINSAIICGELTKKCVTNLDHTKKAA